MQCHQSFTPVLVNSQPKGQTMSTEPCHPARVCPHESGNLAVEKWWQLILPLLSHYKISKPCMAASAMAGLAELGPDPVHLCRALGGLLPCAGIGFCAFAVHWDWVPASPHVPHRAHKPDVVCGLTWLHSLAHKTKRLGITDSHNA